jgi:hypothetical protein
MRRILATLLVTAVLGSSAPSFARRDDGERFNPIRFIKKIIRILVPISHDDGGSVTPPKP